MNDLITHRPRLRFSLRTLLLLFLVIGIVLVVFWIPYERQRRQRLAVARMGGVAKWEDGKVVEMTFEWAGPGPSPQLDKKLADLRNVPELRKLSLQYTWVTNDGLRHLRDLPKLDELQLGDAFHISNSLDVAEYLFGEWRGIDLRTPAGLQVVKNDVWNHSLILRNSDISDAGMEQLAVVSNLRVLSLHNTGVSNEGLRKLARLPKLEELDLRLCCVSNEGIKYLRDFPALKKLDLGNNRYITGLALPDVAKIETLTHFRPPYQLLDQSVILHQMTNLQTLDLSETSLSTQEVQEVREKLPRCKIIVK